ncbi:MAG: hypothetical protein Kapaf2KO_17090 [Candidatus Kapaibacteriales bacterium]
MAIFRVDPFNGIDTIARRMNTLAKEMDKGLTFETGGFYPRVDIKENEEKFFLQMEIPGVEKEDISMTVTDKNTLEITGEKKGIQTEDKTIRSERGFGKFKCEFILAENVDTESVEAEYKNGVLYVSMTKKQPVKKNIEIKVQ